MTIVPELAENITTIEQPCVHHYVIDTRGRATFGGGEYDDNLTDWYVCTKCGAVIKPDTNSDTDLLY